MTHFEAKPTIPATSSQPARGVKFDIQIGSDWPQMGQIWDFLRSVLIRFGLLSQNVNLDWKQAAQIWAQSNIPDWK